MAPQFLYNPLVATVGLFSVKLQERHYSLLFQDLGWMAADLVQYLGEIIESEHPEADVLKLLGMTMRISQTRPDRIGEHWVFVDPAARELDTNSELLRLAVQNEPPPPESPYSASAMRRIHEVLDRYDFTVNLFK